MSRRPRVDSASALPPGAPANMKAQLYNLIEGTPTQGWYETLDPSKWDNSFRKAG